MYGEKVPSTVGGVDPVGAVGDGDAAEQTCPEVAEVAQAGLT
jgi:hypothetical protein